MRQFLVITLLSLACFFQCGIAEGQSLSRHEHLAAAAAHLEAAGFMKHAKEIRRFAMVQEIATRAKRLSQLLEAVELPSDDPLKNSPALQLEPGVLKNALGSLRDIDEQLARISYGSLPDSDAVGRSPKQLGVQGAMRKRISTPPRAAGRPSVLMLTPGRNLIQEEEEESTLGELK